MCNGAFPEVSHAALTKEKIKLQYQVCCKVNITDKRVLNDVLRPRHSCDRTIGLLAHPLSPSSYGTKVSLFLRSSCVSPVELNDGRGE
jgi:hypothetical protein